MHRGYRVKPGSHLAFLERFRRLAMESEISAQGWARAHHQSHLHGFLTAHGRLLRAESSRSDPTERLSLLPERPGRSPHPRTYQGFGSSSVECCEYYPG